jgi:spore germination cell wall hydrolase CwlJ-like protein
LTHARHILATLVAVLGLAGISLLAWTHQADADHLAAHPDYSYLAAGLSQAALDRDLASLDPAAQALAKRLDPVRHAQLAGRPIGWAAYDLDKAPTLGFGDPSFGDARKINALIPAASILNPPARPFVLQASAADRVQAVRCLAQAVYFEAGRQSPEGQAAVAQTVLNRLRHPEYPKSVCGVVYQGASLRTGCQFSFTCDGSLNQPLLPSVWAQAQSVARRALNGYVMAAVGEATHYHADYVQPYWSPTLVKITQIGAHIFYRWTGPSGQPSAFTGRYAGHEAHITPAVLTSGDSRVARSAPAPAGVIGHVRTFTVADASVRGGLRTRVSGVFAAPAAVSTAPAAPVVAPPVVAAPRVTAPALAAPAAAPAAAASAKLTAPAAQDHATNAVAVS